MKTSHEKYQAKSKALRQYIKYDRRGTYLVVVNKKQNTGIKKEVSVLIDNNEIENISSKLWYAADFTTKFSRKNNKKQKFSNVYFRDENLVNITLARFLMNPKKGEFVIHRNNDKTDFTKANLKKTKSVINIERIFEYKYPNDVLVKVSKIKKNLASVFYKDKILVRQVTLAIARSAAQRISDLLTFTNLNKDFINS